MFPLCPPECNVTPLPLVGVCTPPRLHGLLRSTLEACASSKTYGAQPRTNFIFFDSDQVLASPDILSPSRRSSGIPVSASGASPAFYGGFVPAFVRGPFRAQPGLFASPRSSGQTHANSQCGIQSAVFSPPGHLPFHKEEEAPRPSEADGGRAQSTGHPGENFYPPHTLSDGAGSVGKEGAPSSFPASSSATSGPSGKGDAGGGTGESGGGPLAWASSPVGTMSGHASSSVFTAEATLSSLRRAPPGKKKTTVAPEHHLNKGLLRHGWMRKQLTDRPAAYILCFDWREAFSEHPPLAAPPSASSTTALSEPERSTDPWLREQASSCLSSARSCSPVCPASLRRVTSDTAAHSSASSAGPTRSSQSVSGSASSCCPCCPHAGAASRSTGRAAVCDPDAGPSQTQAQERRNGQQGRSHSRDAIRGDVPVPHVSGWPPQENSENFPHCPPGSRLCCRQGFCPKEQKSYGATAEGGRASSGTTTTTAGLGTPLDLEPGGESQRDVGTTMPVLSSPGGGGTRQGISREPAQEEDAGRPVSPWGTEKQGEGTGQSVEGPLAGRGAGLTSGARELAVARAEHAALALIECVRERLHRKKVAPKMVLFVILPVGLSDPQGAVNCLRRLNPSEIAALFVTCGIDDIQTKMERLEQVAHDCGIEHYENESRRYRKQIQHAPKAGADRAQSSASHVFQARNLVKAGYVLEFAGQPHAAMKSFIAAWQLLTTDKQMASAVERMALCNLLSVRMYHMYFQASEPGKAAHHAREHRAVLRENAPEDEEQLLGYLLPQWLAELHQLLGQLLEESSRMQQQQLQLLHTHNQGSTVQSGAGNSGTLGGRGGRAEIGEGMGGMAVPHSFSPTSDAWQNPGFHFQAAARYLQELRLWIRRAKVQLQPPSMKGGLNVQSEWIGQLDTLQHGVEPFSSVTANLHPGTAAVMMRQEVILRWIFSVSEQQVATHATHLLSKAHAVYKMIGGSRHCPVIACQLADALFDSQRMLTARQLYATLAQALSANIYGVGSPPSLLASLTSPGTSPHIAGGRDPSPFRSSVAPSTLVDRHDSSSHSALGTRGAGERWPKEGSSVGRAEAGILPSSATPGLAVLRMPQKEKEMPNSEARGHENFPGLFMDTGGNESDGQGGGLSFWAMKNAGWSPLLFYVLARLLLCVCSLLSVPPPPVLYDLARVNPLLHTFEARRVSSFRAPFRTAGSSSLPRSEGASHSENHVSPWAPLSEPSSSLPPYSSGGVMESHDAPSERLGLPCSMEQTPLVVAEAEGEQDGGTQGNDSISNTPIRTLGPLSALAAEEASGREESVPREESRMPGALPSLLDVENYRIGLLAVFQLFNLLALRRREDDPTLRKRQQLYEFIVFGLVPNLRRFVGENTGAERIETPAVVGRQDCVASSERAQGEGREKSRTDSPSERRDRTEKGLVRGRKVESKGIRESDCGDGKEGNKTQQVIAEISLPSVVGWVRFPSVDELRVTEEAGRVGTSGGRRQEYHSGNLSDGAFSPAQETEQQQRDKKEERAFGEAKPKHINKSRLAVEGVVCLEQNFGVDLTLRCFGVLRTTRGVMACQLIPLSPLRSVLTGFGVDKAGERRTAPEREKHTVSSWRPDGQQDSAGGETAAAEACTLVSGTPSWFRLLVSPGEAVLSLFASFSSHPVPSRVVSLSLAWHDCPAVSFCLSTLLPLDPLHPPPKISQPLSWLNHGRLEKNNCAQPPASSQNADSFKFSRTCDPAPPDVQGEIEGQVTVFRSNQDFHCLSSSYSPSGRLFRSRTLSSFVRLQEKVCFHGCWPDPVQKALLQRQLAVPPPPLPVCSQEFAAASSVHLFLPNHKPSSDKRPSCFFRVGFSHPTFAWKDEDVPLLLRIAVRGASNLPRELWGCRLRLLASHATADPATSADSNRCQSTGTPSRSLSPTSPSPPGQSGGRVPQPVEGSFLNGQNPGPPSGYTSAVRTEGQPFEARREKEKNVRVEKTVGGGAEGKGGEGTFAKPGAETRTGDGGQCQLLAAGGRQRRSSLESSRGIAAETNRRGSVPVVFTVFVEEHECKTQNAIAGPGIESHAKKANGIGGYLGTRRVFPCVVSPDQPVMPLRFIRDDKPHTPTTLPGEGTDSEVSSSGSSVFSWIHEEPPRPRRGKQTGMVVISEQQCSTAPERRDCPKLSEHSSSDESIRATLKRSLRTPDVGGSAASAPYIPCDLCVRDVHRRYSSLGYTLWCPFSNEENVHFGWKTGDCGNEVETKKGRTMEGSEVLYLMLGSRAPVDEEARQHGEEDANVMQGTPDRLSRKNSYLRELSNEPDRQGDRGRITGQGSGPAFPSRRLFMFRPNRHHMYRDRRHEQREGHLIKAGLEAKPSCAASEVRWANGHQQFATAVPALAPMGYQGRGAQKCTLATGGAGDKGSPVAESSDRTQGVGSEKFVSSGELFTGGDKRNGRVLRQAEQVALSGAHQPSSFSVVDWVPSSALGRPWDFHEEGSVDFWLSQQALGRRRAMPAGLEWANLSFQGKRVRDNAPGSKVQTQSAAGRGGSAFHLPASTSDIRNNRAGKETSERTDSRNSSRAEYPDEGSGNQEVACAVEELLEEKYETRLCFQLNEDEDALCVPVLFRTRTPGLVQVRAILEFPAVHATERKRIGFQKEVVEGEEDVFSNAEPPEDFVTASCCILVQKPLEVQIQPAPFAAACIDSCSGQSVPSSSSATSTGEGERNPGGVRPLVYVHVINPSSVAAQLKDVHLEPFPPRRNGVARREDDSAEGGGQKEGSSPGELCESSAEANGSRYAKARCQAECYSTEANMPACSKAQAGRVTAGGLSEEKAKPCEPCASSWSPPRRWTDGKSCGACGAALTVGRDVKRGRRGERTPVAGEGHGTASPSVVDAGGTVLCGGSEGIEQPIDGKAGCSIDLETAGETELLAWPLIGRLQSVGRSESWSALMDVRDMLTRLLQSDEGRHRDCDVQIGIHGRQRARGAVAQHGYVSPYGDFALHVRLSRQSYALPYPFNVFGSLFLEPRTLVFPFSLSALIPACVDLAPITIKVDHAPTPAVGVPFTLRAVITNQTTNPQEATVQLSYPPVSAGAVRASSSSGPAPDQGHSIGWDATSCPYLVSGVLQTEILLPPCTDRVLRWTVVPCMTGAFAAPTVVVRCHRPPLRPSWLSTHLVDEDTDCGGLSAEQLTAALRSGSGGETAQENAGQASAFVSHLTHVVVRPSSRRPD